MTATKDGKDIYYSKRTKQWQYLWNNKPVGTTDLRLSSRFVSIFLGW